MKSMACWQQIYETAFIFFLTAKGATRSNGENMSKGGEVCVRELLFLGVYYGTNFETQNRKVLLPLVGVWFCYFLLGLIMVETLTTKYLSYPSGV